MEIANRRVVSPWADSTKLNFPLDWNMRKQRTIKWLIESEEHDYPAAKSYLSLIYDSETAKKLVKRLRRAPRAEFKAKDIFRASKLSLLGISNARIERDRRKIMENQSLSPILLVRDTSNGKVVIADGYHRMCAVYSFDEDAVIPCKIV
jgi:hypothetical protein